MSEDQKPHNSTTRSAWWLLRWHVARWMIHTALKVAPAGGARDVVESALWLVGHHMRETIAADRAGRSA